MTPDLAVSHDVWLEAGGCAECAGTGWRSDGQALVTCTCDPVRRAALGIDPDPAPILRGVAAAWRLVAELPTFPWLRPTLPIEDLEPKLGLLVEEHDRAMADHGSKNVRWRVRIVRTAAEWESAWEAAWGSDWDAAWDDNQSSAYMAACFAVAEDGESNPGRDAAKEAIRSAVEQVAKGLIRESVEASLGEHAWQAIDDFDNYITRDAIYLVSGLERPNPWAPLVEIWRLGCVPILQGQEAVVYVPEIRR